MVIGRFGQESVGRESGRTGDGAPSSGNPSMEAILSSLRRIIASDPAAGDDAAAPAAPPPDGAASDDAEDDVLDLTRQAPPPPQPSPPTAFPSIPFPQTSAGPQPNVAQAGASPRPGDGPRGGAGPTTPLAVFPAKTPSILRGGFREGDDAGPSAPPPEPPVASAAPVPPAAPEESPAVSAAKPTHLLSDTASSAAVDAFGALNRRPTPAEGPAVAKPAGRTVDDLVLDVVRPEVKAWLDKHLPALVERLVQAEIARLARRSDAG